MAISDRLNMRNFERTKSFDGIERGHQHMFTVNYIGDLAIEMVRRWGMVAGMPDGEDSTGRAKLRLATPDELVKRASECAAMIYDECEKRGWVMPIPFLGDANDEQPPE